ncbi:c-type cytochrome [Reyranella sp.]|jgi:mono/diheme cytochrome c family protein|uniref:c-type cytochrome n=1 Tax=Reyranella sp. TaxID=1929291 RepID=UPI002F95656E
MARMLRRLAFVAALMPGVALAQDVDHGKLLAARWCANCHIVTRGATTGRADGLPTLPAIADDPATTKASLRRAMTASHGRMPNFSLTTREQDDLIAYILSLRRT